MPAKTAAHLASNVRALRESRGLSQEQISKLAGVTRPTWANIESGGANPTLSVLVRVAAALHVTIEELIGPPRASCKLYKAEELRSRSRGGVDIRALLPDPIPGLEIERMELPAGARMTGVPHTDGTREYLTCESGSIELWVAGDSWKLQPGDVVVFRGDQKHSYANPGSRKAVGYTVVTLAPSAL